MVNTYKFFSSLVLLLAGSLQLVIASADLTVTMSITSMVKDNYGAVFYVSNCIYGVTLFNSSNSKIPSGTSAATPICQNPPAGIPPTISLVKGASLSAPTFKIYGSSHSYSCTANSPIKRATGTSKVWYTCDSVVPTPADITVTLSITSMVKGSYAAVFYVSGCMYGATEFTSSNSKVPSGTSAATPLCQDPPTGFPPTISLVKGASLSAPTFKIYGSSHSYSCTANSPTKRATGTSKVWYTCDYITPTTATTTTTTTSKSTTTKKSTTTTKKSTTTTKKSTTTTKKSTTTTKKSTTTTKKSTTTTRKSTTTTRKSTTTTRKSTTTSKSTIV